MAKRLRSRSHPKTGRSAPDTLVEYRRKRDFSRTREPAGGVENPRVGTLAFVIQKHHASHLHFDLRLEVEGVMKSWAVPKGPSRDPSVKRLAMQVEDHPIAYNAFEGTIPKGEYGGGTVMIWDRGTYTSPDGDEDAIRQALERGTLKFTLEGERLRGTWTLVKLRGRGRERSSGREWLLIKHADEFVVTDDTLASDDVASVASGRRMDEITSGSKPVSMPAGPDMPERPHRRSSRPVTPTKAAETVRRRTRHSAAESAAVVKALDVVEEAGGSGRVDIPLAEPLSVTNLGKVYFPKAKRTKGDLMRYYARAAKAILPLIEGRPLVLKRYPNGVEAKPFFQQTAPDDAPSSLRIETVPSESTSGRRIIGGDLFTLLYCVQLGAIELHPWHSRVGSLGFPDYTILDLDPGPKASFGAVVAVARAIKALLDDDGLTAGVKTSGSHGLHIVLPLPPKTNQEAALLVAQIIATRIAAEMPKVATVVRSRASRPSGTVYVDYLQNIVGKSVASAFSVRPRVDATVSTPLEWSEVTARLRPDRFTMDVALDQLDERAKLWRKAMAGTNDITVLHKDT
ncbi:MAG TPA: non-homologous end-joining DNA ligase [Gemmatimonadaceae bacterium]|jgi:bifunctional non-homologous end joining protein LigD|nr:non-homologous end-joining DNA ligase [Gemmatimonadaceae bacterium]